MWFMEGIDEGSGITWPGDACAGEGERLIQENGFMRIKGPHINHWVFCSPPLQKFLDFVGVVGEVFRRFPCAILKRISVKRPLDSE